MVRWSWVACLVTATASAALAQTPRHAPAPPLRSTSAPPLTESVADGMMELLGAQLDRLGDMATTDFALEPLVPARDPDPDVAPAPTGDPRLDRATAAFWESCGLDGAIQPIDLRAGSLLPIQVALSAHGNHAVALVTLGRQGPQRHGMTFPESRWIAWDGNHTTVANTPGFLPDAEVLVRDRDAAVIAYTRRGADGEEVYPAERDNTPLPPTTIGITRFNFDGRILGGPHILPQTEGLFLDGHPVEWQGGTAIVLGRENEPPRDDTRTEEIWFLDRRGRAVRSPLPLTNEGLEEALGAPCVSLSVDPNGTSLTAAWTIQNGPHAGLWARRAINLAAEAVPVRLRGAPRNSPVVRVAQGGGWYSPVASPFGVLVRRSARRLEGDAPMTDVVMAGWPSARPVERVFERFWDPLPVWGDGGIVVVGLGPGDAPGVTRPRLEWAPRDASALRPLTTTPSMMDSLSDAVDIAIAPTDTGALVAWIESIDGDPEGLRRRLAFARVACTPLRPRTATLPSAAPTPPPDAERRPSSAPAGRTTPPPAQRAPAPPPRSAPPRP